MKPRHFIVGLGCLLVLAGVAAWFAVLPNSRSPGISVSLLGYTNVASGLPVATYAGTNPTTGRFAILRVRNPTRRDFFCYFGPMVLWPTDGSAADGIQMRKSHAGDFDLPPRGSALIAVPEPKFAGKWQYIVVLCHRHSYSRWQWPLVRFAQKVGLYTVFEYLDGSNKNWFAITPEIAQ